jgi:hypothetical protein
LRDSAGERGALASKLDGIAASIGVPESLAQEIQQLKKQLARVQRTTNARLESLERFLDTAKVSTTNTSEQQVQ